MQNTDTSGIPVQWSVSWGVASKADGPLPFPFTTSMTVDHAARPFSAEMNECLKMGSGGGGANVRVWVSVYEWLPRDGACARPSLRGLV
jgi:hypothetical protein